VFLVKYGHQLYIKSKAIPVTGRGGPYVCFLCGTDIIYILKSNAFPVTGRGDPWSCEVLKILHCLGNRLTDGGEVVSLTRQTRTTPRKDILVLNSAIQNGSIPWAQCG
jgi:hypothetical protein